MRTILTTILLAFCAGCITFGTITEGRPRHENKFPADVAFFVDPEKSETRVHDELEAALKARGFAVVETADESDFIIKAVVNAWEYNDAGFSGLHPRDDMTLAVRIVDRRKKLVESRATIEIRSDFNILRKYVETL